MVVMRASLLALLLQGARSWSYGDLDALKEQITGGIKDKKDELQKGLADGIHDYKQSAKEYGEALKNKAFEKTIGKIGICEYLGKAEKDEKNMEEMRERMAEHMTETEVDVSDNPGACEAVTTEATAETLHAHMKELDANAAVDDFMKLLTERSSASLCEGKHGLKEWLHEKADLKKADPKKYKEELQKKLEDKVGPTLDHYSAMLCAEGKEEKEEVEEESKWWTPEHQQKWWKTMSDTVKEEKEKADDEEKEDEDEDEEKEAKGKDKKEAKGKDKKEEKEDDEDEEKEEDEEDKKDTVDSIIKHGLSFMHTGRPTRLFAMGPAHELVALGRKQPIFGAVFAFAGAGMLASSMIAVRRAARRSSQEVEQLQPLQQSGLVV